MIEQSASKWGNCAARGCLTGCRIHRQPSAIGYELVRFYLSANFFLSETSSRIDPVPSAVE